MSGVNVWGTKLPVALHDPARLAMPDMAAIVDPEPPKLREGIEPAGIPGIEPGLGIPNMPMLDKPEAPVIGAVPLEGMMPEELTELGKTPKPLSIVEEDDDRGIIVLEPDPLVPDIELIIPDIPLMAVELIIPGIPLVDIELIIPDIPLMAVELIIPGIPLVDIELVIPDIPLIPLGILNTEAAIVPEGDTLDEELELGMGTPRLADMPIPSPELDVEVVCRDVVPEVELGIGIEAEDPPKPTLKPSIGLIELVGIIELVELVELIGVIAAIEIAEETIPVGSATDEATIGMNPYGIVAA